MELVKNLISFFTKKTGFSVIVKLSTKKIVVVQILVYTIKLQENKALVNLSYQGTLRP